MVAQTVMVRVATTPLCFVVLQGAWGRCNGCANLFWVTVQGRTRDGGADLRSRERREGDGATVAADVEM